ncbi:hypothetical protein FOZ62_027195 [Perkinsus olseni]|uniref:Uncharacterized protein n=1 Tax=Perkinsus olseni TaxID=32597 RepID=A0A7J6T5P3_PEROL|nr:hypothetical protein FOZ62_027195 [Perkinsus olseni]
MRLGSHSARSTMAAFGLHPESGSPTSTAQQSPVLIRYCRVNPPTAHQQEVVRRLSREALCWKRTPICLPSKGSIQYCLSVALVTEDARHRFRRTGIDGWDTSKWLWRVLALVRPSAFTWRLDPILGPQTSRQLCVHACGVVTRAPP